MTDALRSPIRSRGVALVAQLDRASDFESEGREFESLRARHLTKMSRDTIRSNSKGAVAIGMFI